MGSARAFSAPPGLFVPNRGGVPLKPRGIANDSRQRYEVADPRRKCGFLAHEGATHTATSLTALYAVAVPRAFISYAHEDQEFVLALAEHLRGQEGLDIRYDQVALHIGDSLIRAISREIVEGDFLIAVVSPDSVESEGARQS